MTLPELQFGIYDERLAAGLLSATHRYDSVGGQRGYWGELIANREPTFDEQQTMLEANPAVVVPDVLELTDDIEEIKATRQFKEEQVRGYAETQYMIDTAVGYAVAKRLSMMLRELKIGGLPHKTVAIVELNTSRGFSDRLEDSYGVRGLPQDHLGNLVIDGSFMGPKISTASDAEQRKPLTFMDGLNSLPDPENGIPRNGAAIRIRPAYPRVPEIVGRTSPREIYEARLNDVALPSGNRPRLEYGVLRGEYRFSRAVALFHDITNWDSSDFESHEDSFARGAEAF